MTTKQAKSSSKRADIRAKIFAARKFQSRIITMFDVEMEVRQPSLGDMLSFQENTDRQEALMVLLVQYCFIPGTSEHIFENADKDVLMHMPFDESIIELNTAIASLTGIDIGEAEGNLNAVED